MLYSSFCWHYEDLMMYSFNYMQEGEGKIWYAIPAQDRTKFEKVANRKYRSIAKEDPNFLFNINSMICPDYLSKKGVTVYSTVQKPGEFILTFPESYHAGFSVGFNVAEAVNFTCPTWVKHAEKAMRIYLKSREKVPVLPLQWIILESNLKLPIYISKIVKNELINRKEIRKEFNQKLADPINFEQQQETSQKDDETRFECSYCIRLCYCSFLKCTSCQKHYCSNHGFICGCAVDKIKLFTRYTDEELQQKEADARRQPAKH